MQERKLEHIRPTYVHKRGEFLQPTDPVTPEVLSLFPPLPKAAAQSAGRWPVGS
jgi:hypothetical protein